MDHEEEHKGEAPDVLPARAASSSLAIDAAAPASLLMGGPLQGGGPNPSPSASHVNFHKDDDVDGRGIDDDDEVAGVEAEMVQLSPKDVESSSRSGDGVDGRIGGSSHIRANSTSLSKKEEFKEGPPSDRPRHDRPEWDVVSLPLGSAAEPVAGSHAVAVEHKAGADIIKAGPPLEGPPVLIAFVNFDSGGQTGKQMADELIQQLGKKHVFDLKHDKGATRGLRKFKGTPNLRVVIGGGDGSINWVLSCMLAEGMTDVPAGCIPLGTGNDSSRAFGWGYKFPGSKKVRQMVERMKTAKDFVKYDRWHSFAQYDDPVTDEFAEHLPASLRPVRRPEELPEFYRHPKTISLPQPPSEKLMHKLPPPDSKPRPHRAATIDVDAREEGYNFSAVQLEERLALAGVKPADPAAAASVAAASGADAAGVAAAAAAAAAPNGLSPHSNSNGNGSALPRSRPLSPISPRTPPSPDASPVSPAEQGPGSTFGGQFNNYLSWGIDAQIQNQFHVLREDCRVCFCGRCCNMAWMGCFGFTNFVSCASSPLDASVEVRDENGLWVDVPLPPGLRTIVLLNTPTYGGGRRLWGLDDPDKPTPAPKEWECRSQRQALDDGLIEIVGITSTWHLGKIMGKFARGVRLAQVNEARLTFRSLVHAQADGEPYRDAPCTYHIRPLKPQTMMTRPEKMPRM